MQPHDPHALPALIFALPFISIGLVVVGVFVIALWRGKVQ